jgi:hypothetical protein
MTTNWRDRPALKRGKATSKMSPVATEIASMPMYRGTRSGDPTVLRGPSYFSSMEIFAKTYGKTAAFTVNLENPLVVSDAEWPAYASNSDNPVEDVAAQVSRGGHDSVVNARKTPGGTLYTIFLVDPSKARLR